LPGRFFVAVYDDLSRLAAARLTGKRAADSLDAKGLIHGKGDKSLRQEVRERGILCETVGGGPDDPQLAPEVTAWLRPSPRIILARVGRMAGAIPSRQDAEPNLMIGLEWRLKAVPQRSGDLPEILSEASGPAESLRPAEAAHAEAQPRLGPMRAKNQFRHREAPKCFSLLCRPLTAKWSFPCGR
jgi:hypothetical protein